MNLSACSACSAVRKYVTGLMEGSTERNRESRMVLGPVDDQLGIAHVLADDSLLLGKLETRPRIGVDDLDPALELLLCPVAGAGRLAFR